MARVSLGKEADDLQSQFLDETGQFKKDVPVDETAETQAGQLDEDTADKTEEGTQQQGSSSLADFQDRARNLATGATNRFNRGVDWIQQQPTPGGIAPLLFALLVFVFAIVPVSSQGYTRLQLIFYTIMGRTNLKDRRTPLVPPDAQSGGQGWTDPGPLQSGGGVTQQRYSVPEVPRNSVGTTPPAANAYVPIDFNNL